MSSNLAISRLEWPEACRVSIELIFAIESRFDMLNSSSTIVLGKIQQTAPSVAPFNPQLHGPF